MRKDETDRVEDKTRTPTRSKRCLPTTITPERSLAKKAEKQLNVHSSSKKLKFGSGLQDGVESRILAHYFENSLK